MRGEVLCVATVFADIAQLGERQTEDLKVPGSIPGVGNFRFFVVPAGRRRNKLSTSGRRTMASWPSG